MYAWNYNLSDITNVYLKDSVPDMSKTNGFNSGAIRRGKFNVDGLGDGKVFLESNDGPFLYIIMGKDFVIINNKDATKTEEIYKQLSHYKK